MKKLILAPLLCLVLASVSCTQTHSWDADLPADQLIETGVRDILAQIKPPSFPDRSVSLIEASGHRPDEAGAHNFVEEIQTAIDALASSGGGTLLFDHPAGAQTSEKPIVTYRIKGPIQLRSNIRLSIEPSVKLQFEFDPDSYLINGEGVLTRYEGTTLYGRSPLIRAFNIENFAIVAAPGVGAMPEIDGDGKRWREWEVAGNRARGGKGQEGKRASYMMARSTNDTGNPIAERRFDHEYLRPCLMEFFLTRNVLVENIKLSNSPFWCVHPVFSENLTFRGIDFEAHVANNDGIDPESSRYVLIEDIDFDNADDNIAIKSGRNVEGREGAIIAGTELEGIQSHYIKDGRIGGPTEHVLIRNNRFRGHYALCIGSEMSGGASHIYALDNVSTTRVNMGFYIKGGRERGGTASHVFVRNLHLNEIKNDAICLIANYDGDTTSPFPSRYTNIYVENLTAKKASNGIRIYGWHDQPVTNVLIRNVTIDDVEETPLGYNHLHDVILEDVTIEGESYDGTYDHADNAIPTPRAG